MHAEQLAIDGYTILPNVVTPNTLEQMRALVDGGLVPTGNQAARRAYAIAKMARRLEDCKDLPARFDPLAGSLMLHEQVISLVTAATLAGPWGTYVMRYEYGEGDVDGSPTTDPRDARGWHVDCDPRIGPNAKRIAKGDPLTVIALWAVDPFTATNGGTELAPGSHLDAERTRADRPSITVEMDAGSVLVFLASHVFHRQGINTSSGSERRRSIRIDYAGIAKGAE